MKKDLFWAGFGKSVATGIALAIIIAIIELFLMITFTSWEGELEIKNFLMWFLQVLGDMTTIFALLGILIGIANHENQKSGFVRR